MRSALTANQLHHGLISPDPTSATKSSAQGTLCFYAVTNECFSKEGLSKLTQEYASMKPVEINDHPSENKKRLFSQSLL